MFNINIDPKDIVRCGSVNENNLPFDEFQRLFLQYCSEYGRPINVRSVNGNILLAEVLSHDAKY